MTRKEYKRINIGISSCLLGNQVRFDGGDKHNSYVTHTLGAYFDFVSFCPEVESGMAIPRPPIRLVKVDNVIHIREVKDNSKDHTETLQNFCEKTPPRLEKLCGFIFKKDSPSCGMERVKVFDERYPQGLAVREGTGIFAKYVQENFPLLPLEEEGRLNDAVLRENFIERVFIYHRWREAEAAGMDKHGLINFHSDHKYIIMAHDQAEGKQLGQLVAKVGATEFETLKNEYITRLMALLKKRVTRGRHANVLSHLMGYIHNELEADDRAELVEMIEQYQQGYVPLIVPITLLKHHFRKYPKPYIERQYYLNPHPGELMLRNQL
jgi:uncharacterized protein YbgA (DUF1722 family)/uncharacterized protein YbbK (DUF523 family)